MILDIKCEYKGGGHFDLYAPVFSSDGKYIFKVWKNVIQCYNTKTGKKVNELKGLTKNVVGFDLIQMDGEEHIAACTKTGKIAVWKLNSALSILKKQMPCKKICCFKVIHSTANDSESSNLFSQAVEITSKSKASAKRKRKALAKAKAAHQTNKITYNTYQMKHGLHNSHASGIASMYGHDSFPNKPKVTTIAAYDKDNKYHFGIYDLLSDKWEQLFSISTKLTFHCDVGGDNNLLAVVQGKKLVILSLNGERRKTKLSINKGRKFTSVACHPTEELILTGDDSGRVLLWQGLFKSEPAQAAYHWHTLPVTTLKFSTSGSQFYSGGHESVLVKWNIDDPDQRKFLPRLPSTIKHLTIAKNNLYVGVTTEDNGLHVFDSRFELISIIQQLVLATKFPAGIAYDTRTKSLIMNGIVGHAQFYSPAENNLLYNLDITQRNKLTQERDSVIKNTELTKIAVSKNGHWLATIEERDDEWLSLESRLKFWYFNATKQTFELTTSVEYPHEQRVLDMQFQPGNSDKDIYCATISEDGKFKLWENQIVPTYSLIGERQEGKNKEGKAKGQTQGKQSLVNQDETKSGHTQMSQIKRGDTYSWRCSGAGYYRNFHPNTLAFSSEGSLLAVGFSSVLTTWIPESCELKCTLVKPLNSENIKHIFFGVRDDCHLIVAATDNSLTVWNMLTLSVIWTVAIDCQLLVLDPFTSNLALFTRDKKVFVFTPSSSTPAYKSNKALLKDRGEVLVAAFVPSPYSNDTNLDWQQRSQLYFIDSNHELYSLHTNEKLVEPSYLLYEDIGESVYKSSLVRVRGSNVKNTSSYWHLSTKKGNMIQDFIRAPNQTKIPVTLAAETILKTMVLQKEKDCDVLKMLKRTILKVEID